jgi:glycosyltransferase involved in cell wall biosynthesis
MIKYTTKPSICFVAHFAYGAMAGGDSGHIGGVERQTSLMARWFAARGYPVSMITWDEGQEDEIAIDGVRIFKLCRRDAGLPGLRFFWPRWSSMIAAMHRADADIYYQNCAEYVTGQAALWCHRNGRKFVYSVASEPDCDKRLPKMNTHRERILYRYGLKRACKIIVQTKTQQEMIRSGFGQDSIVLPMPCPGPSEDNSIDDRQEHNGQNRILWIGRLCEVKRPDCLLDLAEECPDLAFDIVGPIDDTEYVRNVCRRAKSLTNVTLHGPASRETVPEFYQKAKLLCCTSDFEGFPNTFLEAWSYGLPIVSTFDPDNLIADKNMGSVYQRVTELAAGIHELLDSETKWRKASQAAREYFRENHEMNTSMKRFERIFLDAVPMKDESK